MILAIYRWWLVIPVLLLTFWLGLRGIDMDVAGSDELTSIGHIGGLTRQYSPVDTWSAVRANSPNHAPGYFILLGAWVSLTGWLPSTMRILSVLFGVLTVAWTYRLGRDTLSQQTGLFAVIILGTSPVFVWFMHEIRMYTLLSLLIVFELWLYRRIIRHSDVSRLMWFGLFAATAGLLYTHYFSIFPLAAIGLYHLLYAPRNRRWWMIVAVMLAAGVLFLPWVTNVLNGVEQVTGKQQHQDKSLDAGGIITLLLADFANMNAALFGVAIALIALAFVRVRRRYFDVVFLLLTMLLLILVGNIALRFFRPNRVRYFMLLLPLVALTAGVGLTMLRQRWRVLSLALVAAWLVTGVDYNLNRPAITGGARADYVDKFPLQQAAVDLLDVAQPQDFILLIGDAPVTGWDGGRYFNDAYHYYFAEHGTRPYFIGKGSIRASSTQAAVLEQITDQLTIWIAQETQYNIDRVWLDTYLLQDYAYCGFIDKHSNLTIERFVRAEFGCDAFDQTDNPLIQFDLGIQLASATVTDISDESLPVLINWRLTDVVPPNTYSVSLQMLNTAGEKVSQVDYALPLRAFSNVVTMLPVADVPPGTYYLMLTVYNSQTLERLTGRVMADGTGGDFFPIKTLTLETS